MIILVPGYFGYQESSLSSSLSLKVFTNWMLQISCFSDIIFKHLTPIPLFLSTILPLTKSIGQHHPDFDRSGMQIEWLQETIYYFKVLQLHYFILFISTVRIYNTDDVNSVRDNRQKSGIVCSHLSKMFSSCGFVHWLMAKVFLMTPNRLEAFPSPLPIVITNPPSHPL